MPRTPSPVLEITEEIIASAERRNSGHCMWAEALKVAVPKGTRFSVDLQTMRFTKDGFRYTFLTPAPVQSSLVKFDQGDHTKPMSVRLRGGQVTKSGRGKEHGPVEHAMVNGKPTRSGGRTPPMAALHADSPKVEVKKKDRGVKEKDGVTGVGSRRTFGIKHLKL